MSIYERTIKTAKDVWRWFTRQSPRAKICMAAVALVVLVLLTSRVQYTVRTDDEVRENLVFDAARGIILGSNFKCPSVRFVGREPSGMGYHVTCNREDGSGGVFEYDTNSKQHRR
jgi:hypothetical protein